MKKTFSILVLLLLLPIANADIINPGYRGIAVENVIANITDFSDYTLISVGSLGGFNLGMCPVRVIGSDGKVSSYYKFCQVSVFAMEKGKLDSRYLDQNYLSILARDNPESFDRLGKDLNTHLASIGAVEVLSGLSTYKEVPVVSTDDKITKLYTISLTDPAKKPDKVIVDSSWLSYLYIAIPLIALAAIAFVLIKRKRK